MDTAEFDKIEKEFLRELHRIFKEINDSITVLRKEKRFVKSELCLALTCIDSFSRFYKIFQGYSENELNNENEKRFKIWLNDFVFTEENKIYKEHKEEICCDSNLVWRLRNSLLHFYGLPKSFGDDIDVGFWGGSLIERQKIKDEFKKYNKKIILIQPYWLMESIFCGLLVQLEKMKEMIKKEPKTYIERILLAHKVAMAEGGVFIDVSKEHL